MQAGTFEANDAEAAEFEVLVGSVDGVSDGETIHLGPETVVAGEVVSTRERGDWINGPIMAQQPDARVYEHALQSVFVPSSGAYLKQTPLAKFGRLVLALTAGNRGHQVLTSDDISSHYRAVFSCYARAAIPTDTHSLLPQWGITTARVSVLDTTGKDYVVDDATPAWDDDEHIGSDLIFTSGPCIYQSQAITDSGDSWLQLTAEYGAVADVGDEADIVKWFSPTIRKVKGDEKTVLDSAVVNTGGWRRFFIVFDIPDLDTYDTDLYLGITCATGNIYVDGAKIETAQQHGSGTCTSAVEGILTDSSKSFAVNEHEGKSIIIFGGDDNGDAATISANTGDTITADYETIPSADCEYLIVSALANCLPTAFLDTASRSSYSREQSATSIRTGTLTVGGGRSEFASIVVLDATNNIMLTIGENLDGSGSRGIRMRYGSCMYFDGGYIIMREDGSSSDVGKRIRFDSNGLRSYDEYGNLKTAIYPGAVQIMLGLSPLQERVELNDELGIAAVDHQGRTFFAVNPVTKTGWLGTPGTDQWLKYDQVNGIQMGIINIKDVTAAPAVSPTGGGILYAVNGALKWLGSSGTITPLANA